MEVTQYSKSEISSRNVLRQSNRMYNISAEVSTKSGISGRFDETWLRNKNKKGNRITRRSCANWLTRKQKQSETLPCRVVTKPSLFLWWGVQMYWRQRSYPVTKQKDHAAIDARSLRDHDDRSLNEKKFSATTVVALSSPFQQSLQFVWQLCVSAASPQTQPQLRHPHSSWLYSHMWR